MMTEELTSPKRLKQLFDAERIALVGASEQSPWTQWLMRNLLHTGRRRVDVIPVNPNREEVFGVRCIPSLAELQDGADLAFLLTSKSRVPDLLDDVARAEIESVVVLASGYSESGDKGRKTQGELLDKSRDLGLTVLGPNTTGFANGLLGTVPWSVAVSPPLISGPVAGVFESGSIARSSFEFTQVHGVGSVLWASVGNGAVVSTMDVLDYVLGVEDVRSVALFLEAIREPSRFVELAGRAMELGKPLVVMKTGRSDKGRRAGQSHTGAIATDDLVADGVMRQYGVVRVASVEELVTTAALFGYHGVPRGRRMGVVTSSGGACSIVADRAGDYGLELPEFSSEVRRRMSERLPSYASVVNPLDVTGSGHTEDRSRPINAEDELIEVAATDENIDFVLGVINASFLASRESRDDYDSVPPHFDLSDGMSSAIGKRLETLAGIARHADLPIYLASPVALERGPRQRNILAAAGIHLLPGVELGISAIAHACAWENRRKHWSRTRDVNSYGLTSSRSRSDVAEEVEVWCEHRGRELLAAHSVPLGQGVFAETSDQARGIARGMDGPFAVKVDAEGLAHKAAAGGVRLGVDEEDVGQAYQEVIDAVKSVHPELAVHGVHISPMQPDGLELIVGVHIEPLFGPVVTIGLGGSLAEVVGDAAVRRIPLTTEDTTDAISSLRAGPLVLTQVSDSLGDPARLNEIVARIADCALSLGDRLGALEVNPLLVNPEGVTVLDVMVEASPGESSGASTDPDRIRASHG